MSNPKLPSDKGKGSADDPPMDEIAPPRVEKPRATAQAAKGSEPVGAPAKGAEAALDKDKKDKIENGTPPLTETPVATTEGVFNSLEKQAEACDLGDTNNIVDIPVNLTVELGRTKMTIKELLSLSQGSAVPLDGLVGESLNILVNGYPIARGEVVVVADKYGVRITEVITPSDRAHRLGRS